MRKTIKVALFQYKAIVKTKMFIGMLVLAPILMSGGWIAGFVAENNVDTTDKKVAVIDRSGAFGSTLLEAAKARNASDTHDTETGKKVRPAYILELATPDDTDPINQRLELSNRVREGKLHAFLEISADVVRPRNMQSASINYYGQNTAMDDMRRWLEQPINNRIRQLRLKDAGIDVSEVQNLFVWQRVSGMSLVSMNEETGELTDAQRSNEFEAIAIPGIMCMFMYFMLILSTQSLLGSVIEEKTQRIAEVLLGSVKPFEFMMGKLLGGVGMVLTAMAVYISGGITIVIHLGYGSFIPYDVLTWFFAYMILAIFMYGAFAVALGSLASDLKDAQSLGFPAIIPILISFFLAISIIKDPSSTYAIWLSMIPIFSPLVLLFRLGSPGGVPVWQQIVGISGMILFTLFSVWVGGRVFRIGLLIQGKMPKLKNVIRMAVKG